MVIDLDIVTHNIYAAAGGLRGARAGKPPRHIKPTRALNPRAMQREPARRGSCQKLGEAESLADAGFDDILISIT